MKVLQAFTMVSMAVLAVSSGCGDLPGLPTAGGIDGASRESASDARGGAGIDGAPGVAVDGAAGPADASADRAALDVVGSVDGAHPTVDAPGGTQVDAGAGTRVDASGAHLDAAAVDAAMPLVCPAGFADCDGKVDNGCETAINTPSHCGSCTTACAAAPNASAACVSNKCTLKCTAPYQDCDGKYDNGCEIPVGQGNACDRSGLAAFSGSKPPCGTPYCGSAAASNAVANFGSWYCSFCDHCYQFSNGGSFCLYSPAVANNADGTFSGDRCTNCCAAMTQVCPK